MTELSRLWEPHTGSGLNSQHREWIARKINKKILIKLKYLSSTSKVPLTPYNTLIIHVYHSYVSFAPHFRSSCNSASGARLNLHLHIFKEIEIFHLLPTSTHWRFTLKFSGVILRWILYTCYLYRCGLLIKKLIILRLTYIRVCLHLLLIK